MTTAAILRLLTALGQLEFRPMDDNDYAAFADAGADASIAFLGRTDAPMRLFADALGELVGEDIDPSLCAVVSGGRVEIHGLTLSFVPFCYGFDFGDLT